MLNDIKGGYGSQAAAVDAITKRTGGVCTLTDLWDQVDCKECAMDVVVTPASGARNTWSLTDRLGRTVGNIAQSDEGKFVIAFAIPIPSGPVPAIDTVQPTLDAAMDAIALRLKGACQLSSTEGQS